jgi:hypothetical protein
MFRHKEYDSLCINIRSLSVVLVVTVKNAIFFHLKNVSSDSILVQDGL